MSKTVLSTVNIPATEPTVTARSFVVVAPPSNDPSMVRTSAAAYPDPPAADSIFVTTPAAETVTLNVAPDPVPPVAATPE
ncbi:MAG: Uncharacterised protein [Alphaproteobacteria bacterium UBA4588]|nr:MAG: Uncharacterised protein [Alphaproteobacteria bacterium UBA4588]